MKSRPRHSLSSLKSDVRPRELWAWAMYDFANSGYTTLGCVLFTALLWFAQPDMLWLAIICFIASNFFFGSGDHRSALLRQMGNAVPPAPTFGAVPMHAAGRARLERHLAEKGLTA